MTAPLTTLTQQDLKRIKEIEQKMINQSQDLTYFATQPAKVLKFTDTLSHESEDYFGAALPGGIVACITGAALHLPSTATVIVPTVCAGIIGSILIMAFIKTLRLKSRNKALENQPSIISLVEKLPPVERIRIEVLSKHIKANNVLKTEFYTDPVEFCEKHFQNSTHEFILEVDQKMKTDSCYLSKAIYKIPDYKVPQKQ